MLLDRYLSAQNVKKCPLTQRGISEFFIYFLNKTNTEIICDNLNIILEEITKVTNFQPI